MCRATSLEAFQPRWAASILSWIRSSDELLFWSGRDDFPLDDVSIFAQWQADPDISAFVILKANEAVAYGEVWLDQADGSAELGRLLVAPPHRRQGLGQELVQRLASLAHQAGYPKVWMRVFPNNVAALGCYALAGFRRVAKDVEARFNANQRFPFVWLLQDNCTSDGAGAEHAACLPLIRPSATFSPAERRDSRTRNRLPGGEKE